ncbi:MAG: 23S rRNA (guanosine(2251)-2'-O)-methyltransferase RlmB [Armatimonadetes bacterium]|nr:23S rRNA (guanosine(2251)-2'-O)-methyltransferase RlmB [Armatimonadota bacterium]
MPKIAGLNLVFGVNPVAEALRSGTPLEAIRTSRMDQPGVQEILAQARARGVPIQKCDKRELDRICGSHRHQGILASLSKTEEADPGEPLSLAKARHEDPLLLLLYEISDPQNLGSILRSAEGAGVHGVVVTKRRSAKLSPVVSKVSAGATAHVPVISISNMRYYVEGLKKQGLWIVGLESGLGKPLWEADLTGPVAVLLGSEGRGVAPVLQRSCDFFVHIPMYGSLTSLNVGVAAGILLYEIRRQRGPL